MDKRPSVARIVATVFLPFAGGYYLSYLYRSTNAIIAPDLIRDIGLDASDLGLLTSAYFLAFGACQIPLGILLDRYGPRRVQAGLMFLAACGALAFSVGQDIVQLTAARALIGLGVAGGLMASFKAITMWFPPERWALANGFFLASGGLGALSATAPLELAVQLSDWRMAYFGLAMANFAVAAAILFIVPDRQTGVGKARLAEALSGLVEIFRDRLFWRLVPICTAVYAAGFAFQGLWAGPWLADVVGLPRDAIALHLLLLTTLMTVGSILIGIVADRLARRGVSLVTTTTVGTLLFIAAQLPLAFGWAGGAYVVLAGVGLLTNIGALCYAQLSQHFAAGASGRTNTAINVLVFTGAFVVQYLIGWIIDLWPATSDGRYAAEGYQWSLGLVIALQFAAWLWMLLPGRRRANPTL